MEVNLSSLYEKSIYAEDGSFLGKVYEIILDLESGRVVKLLTEPLKGNEEKQKRILKEKSIDFNDVISISDIVLVKNRVHQSNSNINIENRSVQY